MSTRHLPSLSLLIGKDEALMARNKFKSPTLDVQITPAAHDRAVQGASGGCLIADSIKEQYPHLSSVTVDMATIRVSDRAAGQRYTYLTPGPAQHLLLSFDQGWPQATDRIVLKRAVHVGQIRASSAQAKQSMTERLATFEARVAAGEDLSAAERRSMVRLQHVKDRPVTDRPATANREGVVNGGRTPKQGKTHPNLLRGRDRHFGAKLSDPGQAFKDAVDAAVAARMAYDTTA